MNLRRVRKKIKSVDNVKKITKAMELVSAVKMKKYQQLAISSSPYQKFLDKAIRNILVNLEKTSNLLQSPKTAQNKELAVLVTSNKGLCGAFNINLARYLWKNTDKKITDIVTLGKKGAVLASNLGFKIIADYSSNDLFENISALFEFIYSQYSEGKYKNVRIFYNTFVSIIEHRPFDKNLLPIQFEPDESEENIQDFFRNYLIEPSPEEIMQSLLLNYVEEKIRFAVTETQAGEHSARMIAMQNATNNATDILINLTLLRNKLRQENITNELLDMITAKISVESSP